MTRRSHSTVAPAALMPRPSLAPSIDGSGIGASCPFPCLPEKVALPSDSGPSAQALGTGLRAQSGHWPTPEKAGVTRNIDRRRLAGRYGVEEVLPAGVD